MLRRAALTALAAGLIAVAPAQADTLSVTGTGDTVSPSTCPPFQTGFRQCATLRDAIETANTLAGPDQIVLPPTGSLIQLTNPAPLAITTEVSIAGPGTGLMSVGGSDLGSRVFETSLGADVTMTGFTISGGFSSDAGGSVLVASPSRLTLTGMRVRGGQAQFGGGIAVRGALVATNSLIDGNFATTGGGLLVEASGTVQLTNVTIANNQGGGISSTSSGPIDMLHVTVGRNTGAGLTIAGPVTAQASIVASNTGAACASTTFSSVATSVAGDVSCGFPIVADPGLSGALVDTGGEFAGYVTDVLTIPAGSPAEDVVAPCALPFDQRFGQRFTAALAPCDAGAYERAASGVSGQPPVPTPEPPAPTPTPTPTPTPEPTPEFRETVVVEPVEGTVLVCPRRPTQCTPLRAGGTIPFGATVNAKRGTVELTSLSSAGGTPQTAKFSDGIFKVTQSGAYTQLTLSEPLAPCSKRARTSQSKKPKSRKLWGDGKGKFRTKGRYASATVRGTRWLTQDTCAGTLIRVTQGTVTVRDNVLRKNAVVRKGKRYLAKPRR